MSDARGEEEGAVAGEVGRRGREHVAVGRASFDAVMLGEVVEHVCESLAVVLPRPVSGGSGA